MQNKWKKAGCIRRWLSPSGCSHPCQPRRVQWMRAAASVCVSPAASRAAFTCAGVGLLAALPARLRLGWLGIAGYDFTARVHGAFCAFVVFAHQSIDTICGCLGVLCTTNDTGISGGNFTILRLEGFNFSLDRFQCFAHFNLLPLFPRRGVGRSNNSHYIRIAYKYKNYFSGRKTSPLTVEVSGTEKRSFYGSA